MECTLPQRWLKNTTNTCSPDQWLGSIDLKDKIKQKINSRIENHKNMRQVLDDVKPVRPRRQRVRDVTVERFVKRRNQFPNMADQIEAYNA